MKKLLYFLCFMTHLASAMDWSIINNDDVDQFKTLVDQNKTVLSQRDPKCNNPIIHYAAGMGAVKILTFLLDTNPQLASTVSDQNSIPFTFIFVGATNFEANIIKQQARYEFGRRIMDLNVITVTDGNGRRVNHMWPQPDPDAVAQRRANYKKAIDLFIAKGAPIEIPNTQGFASWRKIVSKSPEDSIPAFIKELTNHAVTSLEKIDSNNNNKTIVNEGNQ